MIETKNLPLVSAIITTHNRKNDLKIAVESVLKQTYKNIELIVVDDASDDGTWEYGNVLIEKNIKYIYIDKCISRGGNYARNVGIKNSTGTYIAFLDDDDEWFPEKIEKQMWCVYKNDGYGLVYTGFTAVYDNPIFNYHKLPNKIIEGDLLEKKLYISPYFNTSVILVKKEVIDLVGGFDENVQYWQEYELMLRLIQHTKVTFVNEPLVRIDRSFKQSGRLTNKVEGWKEAVKYINKKHEDVFELLDDEKKILREAYFYKEAAYRASLSGDKNAMKEYYLKANKRKPSLECLIRGKFGLSRKETLFLETIIMHFLYAKERIRGDK